MCVYVCVSLSLFLFLSTVDDSGLCVDQGVSGPVEKERQGVVRSGLVEKEIEAPSRSRLVTLPPAMDYILVTSGGSRRPLVRFAFHSFRSLRSFRPFRSFPFIPFTAFVTFFSFPASGTTHARTHTRTCTHAHTHAHTYARTHARTHLRPALSFLIRNKRETAGGKEKKSETNAKGKKIVCGRVLFASSVCT